MQVQDNGMHRTTIEIPEDIYLETVEAAIKEGLKFSHIVRLALRDWLKKRSEPTRLRSEK